MLYLSTARKVSSWGGLPSYRTLLLPMAFRRLLADMLFGILAIGYIRVIKAPVGHGYSHQVLHSPG